MKYGMTIEYLKCRAYLMHVEGDFRVKGAIGTIATKWDLILIGIFFINIILYNNKSSLIGLYYSYIYPYFTYCLETWGCASKTQLNILFLLSTKINTYNDVFALPSTYSLTEPIFNALHILPFHKLFLYSTGIFMYKYFINGLPLSLCKCILKLVLLISTILELWYVMSVNGHQIFIRISALVWNTLMNKFLRNGSICHFKTTLKLYLLYNNLTHTYPA